jgi:hypothetical protein
VNLIAYSRFAFESWKGQISDPQNTGYPSKESKPKVQKQTQLRETSNPAEKAWPELGLNFFILSLS